MQIMLEAMRRKVLRHAEATHWATDIPHLSLSKVTEPSMGTPTVDGPVACLILQGTKRVTIGETVLQYDSSNYFVASLDLPITGQIADVSPHRPYLALGLTIDRAALVDLIAALPPEAIHFSSPRQDRASFALAAVTEPLLDAWARLLDLLDQPEDIAALAAMRQREVLYRLLRGPLGGMLCQMAREDSSLARIRRSIQWLRSHYDEPLGVAALADIAGMSLTSFHRHFRAATMMSPLQYQKAVRLHSARRLMASGMEAGRAAYAVGYESAPQFSREYRRAFGAPPSSDTRRRGQVAPHP